MKTIDIEWHHLQMEGETCERCGDTGALLRELVANLNRECAPRGVQATLTETLLGREPIQESNQVLINGQPLDASIPAIRIGSGACASCGDLTGREESCRTLELGGESFEVPPAYVIHGEVCRLGRCC